MCWGGGKEGWSVVFANFCGVNTTVDFMPQQDVTECGVGRDAHNGSLKLCKPTPAHHCLHLTVHSLLWWPSQWTAFLDPISGFPLISKSLTHFQTSYDPVSAAFTSLILTHWTSSCSLHTPWSPMSLSPQTFPNPSETWWGCCSSYAFFALPTYLCTCHCCGRSLTP